MLLKSKFSQSKHRDFDKLSMIMKNVDVVNAAAYAHEGLSNFSPCLQIIMLLVQFQFLQQPLKTKLKELSTVRQWQDMVQ